MRRLLLIPALVAAALVYAAFDEEAGVRTWLRLRADLRASEARIEELRSEVDRLRREAAELESDGFAVERAIREDLEFARRGETVVRLSAPRGSNPRFP